MIRQMEEAEAKRKREIIQNKRWNEEPKSVDMGMDGKPTMCHQLMLVEVVSDTNDGDDDEDAGDDDGSDEGLMLMCAMMRDR